MMEISSSEYFKILLSLKKLKPMIHCQNFCSDYISEKIRRQLKKGVGGVILMYTPENFTGKGATKTRANKN